MNIKTLFHFILFIACVLFLAYCAQPMTPQGGPRDEEPPKIINSIPENHSAKFNAKEISIEFNEYIQLRNAYKQLLISPPLAKNPEIKVKKKSVIIKLDEDVQLRENTTYTFFLGDAVVDLTEGNPYENFEFVFSTGDFVDSLSYSGTVRDALTFKPVEKVSVMLYASDIDSVAIDSLPLKVRPNYVAQTDKEGKFVINNLRDVPYKVFALVDQNTNYLYDVITEDIAFLDTLVNAYYDGPHKQILPTDSLALDSINKLDLPKVNYEKIPANLLLFKAQDSIQEILESKLVKKYHAEIILKYPSNTVIIDPLNFKPSRETFIREVNKTKDTINLWFYPEIQDTVEFSVIADQQVLDTIKYLMKPKSKVRNNKKESEKDKEERLKAEKIKIATNIEKSKADFFKNIELNFDSPVRKANFESIVWMEDSLKVEVPMHFTDSTYKKVYFDKKIEQKVKYKIIIPDSTFYSLRNFTHDSIEYAFEAKTIEDYGKIIFKVNIEEDQQWIIQLLIKDKVITERIVTSNEDMIFEHMIPGKYKIKAIHDVNKNGQWDTGNYSFKRQAEKIILLDKELDVRANWDFEETLNLK